MDTMEPNLYECPRCHWITDVGGDDLAGDENAVALRIAHKCAGGSPDVTDLVPRRAR
jgi:hypothetical protein